MGQTLTLKPVQKKEWVCFIFCILLLLFPEIVFYYFPNQDGSAHVNSAFVLERLNKGSAFLSLYFRDAHFVLTNGLTTVILNGLHPVIAARHLESAFACMYIECMILAVYITVRHLFCLPLGYTLLFFPLVYTHMLHMGSFNFALACAPFLILLGLCHRYIHYPSLHTLVFISLTSLLLFVLHAQMALIGLACMGIYSLCMILYAIADRNAASRSSFIAGAKLALACVPVCIMLVLFSLQNSGLKTHVLYTGFLKKIIHLVFLSGIASYSVFGMAVSLLLFASFMLGIYYASVYKNHSPQSVSANCMLSCGLFLLILFFLMPNGLGDVFNIEERIMAPMLLVWVSWISIGMSRYVSSQRVIGVCMVLIALQTTDRVLAFAQVNHDLKEYAEAYDFIPDHSAIGVINLEQITGKDTRRDISHPFALTIRFDPERNFMGTVLGDRDIALVSNYEAQSVRPYFALKYQPDFEKVMCIDGCDKNLNMIAEDEAENGALSRLIEAAKASEKPIGYFAVWTSDPASAADPKCVAALMAIKRNYEKFFTSSGFHMTLYKSKALMPPELNIH